MPILKFLKLCEDLEDYLLALNFFVLGPTISTKFPSGSLSINKQISWGKPSGSVCGLFA
jgi:hypothetical protein